MPDRDEKGDDLADRMSRRFGGDSETGGDAEESQAASSTQGSKSSKTATSDTAPESDEEASTNVSDRPSVLMYLPEEQRRELDLRFDELNLKHKREHGEALQKNRDYYPAVVEAALSDRSLEEILLEE